MYPWYVYQPTRATEEKKGKTESAAGGKGERERIEGVIVVTARSQAAMYATLALTVAPPAQPTARLA